MYVLEIWHLFIHWEMELNKGISNYDICCSLTQFNIWMLFIAEESLADYVEEVARSVEEQALTVVMNREKKRRMFVLEMLKRLGKSVVSFDAMEYRSASFLLDRDGFMCILEVMLPLHFPSQPPQYRLLSVYSTTTPEAPLSQTLNKIRYSESWQVHNMVEEAINVIKHKRIPGFQTVSTQRFQIPQ